MNLTHLLVLLVTSSVYTFSSSPLTTPHTSCPTSNLTATATLKTLSIPMRDGVHLPADLHLPSPGATNLPCILVRTPYGRKHHAEEYEALVQEGYAVVIQDLRSSADPACPYFPYFTDAWGDLQDGYDTVEWLAAQPFTNGKIATSGISARGIAQNMLAPSSPPHLICQHIGFSPSGLHEALYQGGVLQKNLVEGWFARYTSHPALLAFAESKANACHFWEQYDSVAAAGKITAPALHYGGWYDLFLQGTLKSFVSRQEHGGVGAKGNQTLVIGPWTHHWQLGKHEEQTPWPKLAYHPPVDISLSSLVKRYLKGNQTTSIPAVTYYVMGPLEEGENVPGHVWKQSNQWPVPAEKQNFYLSKAGTLNTTLACIPESSCFTFQPQDPVPSIGGRNLFLSSGPLDQRSIQTRADSLFFTSEPLKEDLEVTGPLEAMLFCQPGGKVMDVAIRLTDVYPDGRSLLISEGLTRVHLGENDQEKVQEVYVDLWATSQVFAKGHRIGVHVSASHFPKYAPPSNASAMTHTLLFGPSTPSRIILPIVH